MKSIKEILDNYKEYETFLDDRFGRRFCGFLTEEQGKTIGYMASEGNEWGTPKEWTKENVINQLKEDVRFGLKKAEAERGISANLMHEVVKSWLKVLEDNELLVEFKNYEGYGKGNFKKVAQKYNIDISDI